MSGQPPPRDAAFLNTLLTFSKHVAYHLVMAVAILYTASAVEARVRTLYDTEKKGTESVRKIKRDIKMNEHERIVASELILPEDIKIRFADVGGLDDIIQSLEDSVLLPLKCDKLYDNELLAPPKGVLLFGPPGCGKTMLAKAIACEAGAAFINLRISTLTEKWFGESQKLVKAVFTLAHKLQPAIIFIDEIDSFLRERQSNDHETIGMMKAEFMSLWDGLQTNEKSRIVVLGATNRPGDLDKAILRRMPKMFSVGLPNEQQRVNILRLTLRGQNLDPSCSIEEIARRTSGYSGSDIKELCRNAANRPMREYMREHNVTVANAQNVEKSKLEVRPLRLEDFTAEEQVQSRRIQEQVQQQNRAAFVRFNLSPAAN